MRLKGARQAFQEPGDFPILQLKADDGFPDQEYERERREGHMWESQEDMGRTSM